MLKGSAEPQGVILAPHVAQKDSGFSLVEALVALFLFGAAAVGLAQLQAQSLRLLQQTETASLGGLLAQNTLVETLAVQSSPRVGVSEGQTRLAGRSWTWRRRIEATEDPRVAQISVAVFAEGEDHPCAQTVAFAPLGQTPP